PYDLKALGHNSPAYLHHLIEAKKLAFADLQQYVADPGHMKVTPQYLLSDAFIAGRRSALDSKHAAERVDPGPAATASETIYLTAADAQGNMISFINSLFGAFGSGVVVPGTGFALQNRGAGFTLNPGHPNTVAPGKRPFHTIIPALVTRSTPGGDEPWMSFGVMGGAMQPQGHVQVLLNMLVFGMDAQQAIDAPRFRHLSGREVILETEIPATVRETLRSMGHDAQEPPAGRSQMFGGGQAIVKAENGWMAGSDRRKDGLAGGY
ncbi:MAG: gamma-glutamyltransferase, partial [Gemmatimonadetes bacterium]|nr:gamma-glutamyltransferase [Gemmatimonadota bacterium]